MSQQSSTDLVKLVNSSGFLLQLAVESLVNSRKTRFGLIASEYAWWDPVSKTDRYVDLILEAEFTTLVIECKRPRGGEWVFLSPRSMKQPRYRARCPRLDYSPGARSANVSYGNSLDPPSFESAYCVVKGQTEERLMLERICSELVRATQVIVEDEITIAQTNQVRRSGIYVPAVVTSTPLFVSQFDPGSIDLSEGTLPEDGAEFLEVPFVRFTKSFTSTKGDSGKNDPPQGLEELNRFRERTVLVINAASLQSVLQQLSIAISS